MIPKREHSCLASCCTKKRNACTNSIRRLRILFKIVILHAMNTVSLASILVSLYPLYMNNVYMYRKILFRSSMRCYNFCLCHFFSFINIYFFCISESILHNNIAIRRLKSHKTYPALECFNVERFFSVVTKSSC